MTRDEVLAWIRHHSQLFPAFATYASRGGEAVVTAVERLMRDVVLEDALKASEELWASPDSRPRSASDHPVWVARRARELGRQRGATEPEPERCEWGKCTLPAVYSPSVAGRGPWYCRFHGWCHRTGHEPTLQALREWREWRAGSPVPEVELPLDVVWQCVNGTGNVRLAS